MKNQEIELEVDEKASSNNLAFEIPLRSLLPKGLKNLVVTGRIIGATHEAAASLRVSPVCMALGEVAGTLASLATSEHKSLREVDYQQLVDVLHQNHHITKY